LTPLAGPVDTPSLPSLKRDLIIWGGGALLVVLAVLAWGWWTAPEQGVLPSEYRYGVM